MPLPSADAPERAPVERLLAGPAGPAELERLAAAGGTIGLARWLLWARRAHERGLLGYRLQTDGGTVMADLSPTRATAVNFLEAEPPVVLDTRVQLSRFTVLRRVGSGLILESPLATMQAELSVDAAAAVAACAVPVSTGDPLPFPEAIGAVDGRTLVWALLVGGLLAAKPCS